MREPGQLLVLCIGGAKCENDETYQGRHLDEKVHESCGQRKQVCCIKQVAVQHG